jgi:hypothetical protein
VRVNHVEPRTLDNAAGVGDQTTAVAEKLQLIQTDAPWSQIRDLGAYAPLRPIDATTHFDPADLYEPGARSLFAARTNNAQRHFASEDQGTSGTVAWETLPSSTRPAIFDEDPVNRHVNPRRALGQGCLRAATLPTAPGADGVTLCRQVHARPYTGTGGADPDEQKAVITVEISQAGQVTVQRFLSAPHTSGGPGDWLGLIVQSTGTSSCITAESASALKPNGDPDFQPLVQHCFGAPLRYQGLAAGVGDVLFTATRKNGASWSPSTANLPSQSYSVVDLSVPGPASTTCVPNGPVGCGIKISRAMMPNSATNSLGAPLYPNGNPLYGPRVQDALLWQGALKVEGEFTLLSQGGTGRAPIYQCVSDLESVVQYDISSGNCIAPPGITPVPVLLGYMLTTAPAPNTTNVVPLYRSQFGYANRGPLISVSKAAADAFGYPSQPIGWVLQ